MSPTADATLLPPPLGLDDDDDHDFFAERGSRKSLDAVGPIAVLGAMVDQRRASRPVGAEAEKEEIEAPAERLPSDDSDADATQPRPRVPANSDAFLKAR